MIVITVRGGVVQHIRSDEREARVLVVDHDYDDDHGPHASLEDAEYDPEGIVLALVDYTTLTREEIDRLVKPRS